MDEGYLSTTTDGTCPCGYESFATVSTESMCWLERACCRRAGTGPCPDASVDAQAEASSLDGTPGDSLTNSGATDATTVTDATAADSPSPDGPSDAIGPDSLPE